MIKTAYALCDFNDEEGTCVDIICVYPTLEAAQKMMEENKKENPDGDYDIIQTLLAGIEDVIL